MNKKTKQKRYTYKVWVEVERYDDQTDTYNNLDMPFSASAEFETEPAAMGFADALHALALASLPLCQPAARGRTKRRMAVDA